MARTYAVQMLELLDERMLSRMGEEGRMNVLNAILKEAGCEGEIPMTCPETGKPTRAAEDFYKCFKQVLQTAAAA